MYSKAIVVRCYAGGNHSGRESKRKESSLLVAVVGQVRWLTFFVLLLQVPIFVMSLS